VPISLARPRPRAATATSSFTSRPTVRLQSLAALGLTEESPGGLAPRVITRCITYRHLGGPCGLSLITSRGSLSRSSCIVRFQPSPCICCELWLPFSLKPRLTGAFTSSALLEFRFSSSARAAPGNALGLRLGAARSRAFWPPSSPKAAARSCSITRIFPFKQLRQRIFGYLLAFLCGRSSCSSACGSAANRLWACLGLSRRRLRATALLRALLLHSCCSWAFSVRKIFYHLRGRFCSARPRSPQLARLLALPRAPFGGLLRFSRACRAKLPAG